MAIISLEPGESFEHYHRGLSQTTLLEGSVTYLSEGMRFRLARNAPITVEPNMPHTLRNDGDTIAHIACRHIS